MIMNSIISNYGGNDAISMQGSLKINTLDEALQSMSI